MKKSLQRRMLYSFVAVVALLLLGVSLGTAMLIRDYFVTSKQQDLISKGYDMAQVANEYFEGRVNQRVLGFFVNSVDSFLDARVWVLDASRHTVAVSVPLRIPGSGPRQGVRQGSPDRPQKHAGYGHDSRDVHDDHENRGLGPGIDPLAGFPFKKGLDRVFEGETWWKTFYHPYYNENMLIVALPVVSSTGDVVGAVILNSPVRGINEFMNRIYFYVAITGILGMVTAAIVAIWLSRTITKPLYAMQGVAASMAKGDYAARAPTETEDEVGQLGHSLNTLAQELENFVSRTKQTEKLLRDFVANVSHELRTPLTIIRGYNEALLDGTITDPELAGRYHRMMRDEAVRLERLIKDLLDLSRLQADNVAMEMERIPLASVAEGVLTMVRHQAEQKDIETSFATDDPEMQIFANPDRITQLVLILVDNAIKYTPSGGKVSIYVGRLDGRAVLSVRDTGIGIPPEDIPFIWERFYKVDKAHSRAEAEGGTGLGLAIAKEIIERHGASVTVESVLGQGTEFRILFPLAT